MSSLEADLIEAVAGTWGWLGEDAAIIIVDRIMPIIKKARQQDADGL